MRTGFRPFWGTAFVLDSYVILPFSDIKEKEWMKEIGFFWDIDTPEMQICDLEDETFLITLYLIHITVGC